MQHAEKIDIRFHEPSEKTVSPLLFGTNLEHTRSCVYKGLSAQMLRNRKFAGKPTYLSGHAHEWYPIGEKTLFVFAEPYTRHSELYHMSRANEMHSQRIVNACAGRLSGLGQHELCLKSGVEYEFRIVAKTSEALTLKIELTSRFGGQVYAGSELTVDGDEWRTYETTLISCADDGDADLRLTFTERASLAVGAVSLMPAGSFHGMRPDVVEKLKQLNIKLLRWPGGNFAGEYNWLDGLLPTDQRAPLQSWLGIETQPLTMGYDFHEIGTDEFIALCREIGAEPFITINPAWNTPEENAAWVEYCNGDPSTPYGRLRAERGHEESYDVKLWSLGNEFGYGHMEGANTAEAYRQLARRNAEKMLAACPGITLCSSGPYPNEEWAKTCAAALGDIVPLVSQHYYAHNPEYPSAVDFGPEYEKCVSSPLELRQQLRQNRAALPENVSISMDEWNVWFAWNRRSNVCDAIFAARTLHMLLSNADTLGIAQACHFEAVNEGLIEVSPYGARLTAQGEIFSLMSGHRGGRRVGGCADPEDLNAFATEKAGRVFLTVVNPSYDKSAEARIEKAGRIARARLYTSESVIPPSDFTVTDAAVEEAADGYALSMPPHSIAAVELER